LLVKEPHEFVDRVKIVSVVRLCHTTLLLLSFSVGEVASVGRVVWVRILTDFNVSNDLRVRSSFEPDPGDRLALGLAGFAEEAPPSVAEGTEVFFGDPSAALVGMSSFCPLPEALENGVVDLLKGSFAAGMLVIARPTLYNRVELLGQVVCTGSFVSFDDGSKFLQVLMYGLFGWFC